MTAAGGFGKIVLDGMFGEDRDDLGERFVYALGLRTGNRCRDALMEKKYIEMLAQKSWDALRVWLLKDLPGEEPLPDMLPQRRRRK